SAHIYRMEIPFTIDEVHQACLDTVRTNKKDACYLRPIVMRGYGAAGVDPVGCPIDTYIACWEWGKYLGEEALRNGVDVCISSWRRPAPDTLPQMAKAAANYMNSQLIRLEAKANGYVEGIALDVNGCVSEGSGENVFAVIDGAVVTPPLSKSAPPPLFPPPFPPPPRPAPPATPLWPSAAISTFRSPSKFCRAKCFTSRTKFSSAALPRRLPRFAPLTALPWATALAAQSPSASRTNSSQSQAAASPIVTAGSPRSTFPRVSPLGSTSSAPTFLVHSQIRKIGICVIARPQCHLPAAFSKFQVVDDQARPRCAVHEKPRFRSGNDDFDLRPLSRLDIHVRLVY